jgi:hypothetical protein
MKFGSVARRTAKGDSSSERARRPPHNSLTQLPHAAGITGEVGDDSPFDDGVAYGNDGISHITSCTRTTFSTIFAAKRSSPRNFGKVSPLDRVLRLFYRLLRFRNLFLHSLLLRLFLIRIFLKNCQ